MSSLIDSWLISFQSLHIEGIGTIQWKRVSAARIPRTHTIQSPEWQLIFSTDPNTTMPADFMSRLSCFANRSIEEVERQYRDWLRVFQSDAFSVSVLDRGVLIKDSSGEIIWTPSETKMGPPASLKYLPLTNNYLYRRWDFSNRLIAALALLAIGWIVAIGVQKGVQSWLSGSQQPASVQPPNNNKPPYLEIR